MNYLQVRQSRLKVSRSLEKRTERSARHVSTLKQFRVPLRMLKNHLYLLKERLTCSIFGGQQSCWDFKAS